MSKSILVIDTPDNCNECELHALTECDYNKEFYCVINGKIVEEFACSKAKPDWCPLRNLPRKKMLLGLDGASNAMEIRERGRQEGFNACIDEILKGANGNE